MQEQHEGPLRGLRILDISTMIAAPWAATLLADLGASVLKIELPLKGDQLRALAPHKGNVPLWWKVTNRNKKGVTLDLRKNEGRALFERLLPHYDVLIENFRPGTLDGWGLSKERLFALQPHLTILRVTGFGQTGPYKDKPAFARVAEAMSGFTYICGEPAGPPLHMGFPLADAVTGLFGAIGILGALYQRLQQPNSPGQEIDVNLVESTFRILDFLPIEHDQLGSVRERTGNLSAYSAPSNIYRTKDGTWITIPASSQVIFERLCTAIGQDRLADDVRFKTNRERLQHREVLDQIISATIAEHNRNELGRLLDQHEVGWSPVYSIADIFADPHFQARRMIVDVNDTELGMIKMQNVVPRYSGSPGRINSSGPALGQHNQEIFGDQLKLSDDEIERLKLARVI